MSSTYNALHTCLLCYLIPKHRRNLCCASAGLKKLDKNSFTKLMWLVVDVFTVFPNVLKLVHKYEKAKFLK